ncbi:MAG: hypothetical protein GX776_07000 [Oxalobacter sp.]|nr:hypothetical protein [Oxalobacter sp.]
MDLNFEGWCNLKVGDVIEEYGYGQKITTTVITAPVVKGVDFVEGGGATGNTVTRRQVTFQSKADSGREIKYGATEGLPHYAPKIYKIKGIDDETVHRYGTASCGD